MGSNILIACILLIFSIFIHGLATRVVMKLATKKVASSKLEIRNKELVISLFVLIMFLASFLESLAWALTYLYLDAVQSMEEAIYFSIVTFTTLGYGDITLTETYRLLASIEAANGIIIFGWSTAIIMAVVQRFYFKTNNNNT